MARKAIEYFGGFGCKFSGNGLGASEGLLALGDLDDPLEVKMKTVGRNVTPGSHYKVVDREERELAAESGGRAGRQRSGGFHRLLQGTETRKTGRSSPGTGITGRATWQESTERGYITITGRRKDVIMRGGETLVPGEMENLIRMHPGVERVAVIGMPDERMGERACAYVVLRPGKGLTFEEMIAFLKAQGAGVLLLPERLELVSPSSGDRHWEGRQEDLEKGHRSEIGKTRRYRRLRLGILTGVRRPLR